MKSGTVTPSEMWIDGAPSAGAKGILRLLGRRGAGGGGVVAAVACVCVGGWVGIWHREVNDVDGIAVGDPAKQGGPRCNRRRAD